jgi:hypothetical protein
MKISSAKFPTPAQLPSPIPIHVGGLKHYNNADGHFRLNLGGKIYNLKTKQ